MVLYKCIYYYYKTAQWREREAREADTPRRDPYLGSESGGKAGMTPFRLPFLLRRVLHCVALQQGGSNVTMVLWLATHVGKIGGVVAT